jgi:hypothetical protein
MEVPENPSVQNPDVNNENDNQYVPSFSLLSRNIQCRRGPELSLKDTPVQSLRYQRKNPPAPEEEIDLNTSWAIRLKRKPTITHNYLPQDFVNCKKIKQESNYLRYLPSHKRNSPATFPNNIPLQKPRSFPATPAIASSTTTDASDSSATPATTNNCRQRFLSDIIPPAIVPSAIVDVPSATAKMPATTPAPTAATRQSPVTIDDYQLSTIAKSLVIQIQLHGHTVNALVDTGTNIDVVSERTIKWFGFPTKSTQPLKIWGYATPVEQTVTKITTLPTQIFNIQEQWSFFTTNTHHEVILGVPWIRAHRAEFDWDSMHLKIGQTSILFTTYEKQPAPVISAFQTAQHLKEQGALGGIISLHIFLAELAQEQNIPEDLQALLKEFENRFPSPIPGVKFANLPPGLPPD